MMSVSRQGVLLWDEKGSKPHLKGSLCPCLSLIDNFLVQQGDVMASLVPS